MPERKILSGELGPYLPEQWRGQIEGIAMQVVRAEINAVTMGMQSFSQTIESLKTQTQSWRTEDERGREEARQEAREREQKRDEQLVGICGDVADWKKYKSERDGSHKVLTGIRVWMGLCLTILALMLTAFAIWFNNRAPKEVPPPQKIHSYEPYSQGQP